MQRRRFIASMPAIAAPLARASAQERTIRLVVPFPPGGSTDVVARILGQEMGVALGRTVVVENRPGASGAIGIEAVARSAPDGATLGVSGVGPTILLELLDTTLPYRTARDLAIIGYMGRVDLLFVARPGLSVRDLGEVLAHARANPGRLTYGSSGSGGPIHLSFEDLRLRSGIDIVHVPYRGDIPALNDLAADRLDLGLLSESVAVEQVRAGRIRALAAGGPERSRLMPDLKMASEFGLPDFAAYVWTMLVAPAGTPQPIAEHLNRALNAALARPEVQERVRAAGMSPGGGSLAEVQAFVVNEATRWSEIIRRTGLRRE